MTKSRSFTVKCGFDFRVCSGVFIILAWLAMSAARAQTASYALGTTNLAVGPSAGSNSVVLAITPQTSPWTATANASWLHLSPANRGGTGSMNVIFSYDANPGATRSGSLTIAGQTLTVTQAGSTYVAAGPVVTLVPPQIVPADTEGPFGLAVDSAGNAYTLYSDPDFNGAWFVKWQLTNDSWVQVDLPPIAPAGNVLAMDGTGNIYFADYGNSAVDEWLAASGNVVTLVSSGLNYPQGIAVDQSGNVYIADTSDYAIKEWTATNGNLTTLVPSGLSFPVGVAVDRAGNVYIADYGDSTVKEWIAANSNLTTVVSSGLNKPWGVAVDGGGNVYIADDSATWEWTAANSNLITLLSQPGTGLAVDGAGNVYQAFPGIQELVRAFVDPTTKAESADAGNDSLPAVLPVTQDLLAPFAPTSGQTWLTITGITNGVVSFSFTANPGVAHTAYITLLGQAIPVAQAGANSSATWSLGATNRLEGPTQGSDSVALAVTIPTAAWTATANASWLHLSPANQSGTGSMNVIFSYDASPGATRSGSLTIAGQTLTVTQAGSTYVAAGTLTTLVSSGLRFPAGVAVDSAGNVYIADSDNSAIKKWTAANNTVNTLVSSGLDSPQSLTLDAAGNVYIADTSDHAIKEWTAANGNLITLVSGSQDIFGVAVDSAGNVYFSYGNSINEWSPASSNVATLVSSGLNDPIGVAVNQAGDVYIADSSDNAVKEWSPVSDNLALLFGSAPYYGLAVDGAGNVYAAAFLNESIQKWTAASNTVSTLVASGLDDPDGVAVDAAGNVYIADDIHNAIKELPYAFVDPTAKAESGAAGNDSLPVVLPATENLLAPFAPTSDQSWLTITGVTNDVVSFSFTANPGAARTAHITLLGQAISITQEPFVTPPILTGAQMLSNGAFNFYFTDSPSASLTVLSTTNLLLPGSNWTVVGEASNIGSNLFQFTDTQTSNNVQRFYRIRSP